MKEPTRPITRPALLDVPVKRKAKKSAFLRNIERQQRTAHEMAAAVERAERDQAEARQERVREAARAGLRRPHRPALPQNVTPIKGRK
jgi:hypothetical protein